MMMRLIASVGLMLTFSPLWAQTEISLWPDGAPGALKNEEIKETTERGNGDVLRTWNVTDPTITYFKPTKKTSDAAVIICPGGGYKILAIEHEGTDIARWFNAQGITAFVLKYRLPDASIMENKSMGPLDDVMQAISLVKKKATEWDLNPDQIGVMGFSAGGHLAASASTLLSGSAATRPAFSILVYPVISMIDSIGHKGSRVNLLGLNPSNDKIRSFSPDEQVNENTPPAFLVHSSDDTAVKPDNSIRYFQALQRQGIPGELHIFNKGGHGYGMAKQGTHAAWPEMCLRWLKTMYGS
ncbi:MAG: alpha/beta hydrolase [Cyclobacteriaceae bacterium]|nr:alpha/beta hydrolase [Cyclobacteriaceae bacterium]